MARQARTRVLASSLIRRHIDDDAPLRERRSRLNGRSLCRRAYPESAIHSSEMAEVQRVKLGYNNVYAVRVGDETVLVDTGPDYRGA